MLERPTQKVDTTATAESLLPYIQFHMLVQGEHPFDAEQQSDLLRTYEDFRARLLPLVVGGVKKTPATRATGSPNESAPEGAAP